MQETVNTRRGRHSQCAVPHARVDCNQDLEVIHAKLQRRKQLPATLIQAHTTHGAPGQHAPKRAEVVDNREDVIILVARTTKQKIRTAIQIQANLVNGLHGVNALQHAEAGLKLDQEFIHALESKKHRVKFVTRTLVPSGVDGHSGDFAVQRVVKELGCDTDNAEEDRLELASVLEDQLKLKNATPVLAVISHGEDGVPAVYKEPDKCNSSFVVTGVKISGPTEHVTVQHLDIEEQTSTVWTTTNFSQPH